MNPGWVAVIGALIGVAGWVAGGFLAMTEEPKLEPDEDYLPHWVWRQQLDDQLALMTLEKPRIDHAAIDVKPKPVTPRQDRWSIAAERNRESARKLEERSRYGDVAPCTSRRHDHGESKDFMGYTIRRVCMPEEPRTWPISVKGLDDDWELPW